MKQWGYEASLLEDKSLRCAGVDLRRRHLLGASLSVAPLPLFTIVWPHLRYTASKWRRQDRKRILGKQQTIISNTVLVECYAEWFMVYVLLTNAR